MTYEKDKVEKPFSSSYQDSNLLQTRKEKIRSTSLPQELVDLNNNSQTDWECSQKTRCSLSLSAIYERLHNHHSVLEDSFLRGTGHDIRYREDGASGEIALDCEDFLQIRNEKIRARSLPVDINETKKKSQLQKGEWTQKLSCPAVSLTNI